MAEMADIHEDGIGGRDDHLPAFPFFFTNHLPDPPLHLYIPYTAADVRFMSSMSCKPGVTVSHRTSFHCLQAWDWKYRFQHGYQYIYMHKFQLGIALSHISVPQLSSALPSAVI